MTNATKIPVKRGFLETRNMLMDQHGWNRRVATIATRLYRYVDTPAALQSAKIGQYGRSLLSETEYRRICRAW